MVAVEKYREVKLPGRYGAQRDSATAFLQGLLKHAPGVVRPVSPSKLHVNLSTTVVYTQVSTAARMIDAYNKVHPHAGCPSEARHSGSKVDGKVRAYLLSHLAQRHDGRSEEALHHGANKERMAVESRSGPFRVSFRRSLRSLFSGLRV